MESLSINTVGSARPTLNNSTVKMATDGKLDVYGMGAGNASSSSIVSGFSGLFSGGASEGNFNTSEFKDVNESGYLSVKTNPLSTFAADVDTASYSNLRNILRKSNIKEYFSTTKKSSIFPSA